MLFDVEVELIWGRNGVQARAESKEAKKSAVSGWELTEQSALRALIHILMNAWHEAEERD
jgi:hypothetical protein